MIAIYQIIAKGKQITSWIPMTSFAMCYLLDYFKVEADRFVPHDDGYLSHLNFKILESIKDS